MDVIVREFKRMVYGALPYLYTKTIFLTSSRLPYYRYLVRNGYTHYPYDFASDYLDTPVRILKDDARNLPYILHRGGKRLYFPRNFAASRIEKNYKALLIEQDIRHAHHYVDSLKEFGGRILLDVGAAEGMISLDAVDAAEFVYLFECDANWIEALTATFEPWREKVIIVRKYVSGHSDEMNITLDDFFVGKSRKNLFLKMDIEGAECAALAGAEKLFSEAEDLQFAICVYHRRRDKSRISAFLKMHCCNYFLRDGYFYVKHKLRRALIRGHKN